MELLDWLLEGMARGRRFVTWLKVERALAAPATTERDRAVV